MPAANPDVINIPEGEWFPIAENIKIGLVKILTGDAVYYETNRLTGEDEPTLPPSDPDFEGAAIYYRLERFAGESVVVGVGGVQATSAVDIYIYCDKGPGKIRLDRGE